MPENTLNFSGLTGEEHLRRLKRHLEEHSPTHVTIIVDTETCRDNISRFLSNAGYVVHMEHSGSGKGWKLHGKRIYSEVIREDLLEVPSIPESSSSTKWVRHQEAPRKYIPPVKKHVTVLLTSSQIGTEDAKLGEKLMESFLGALPGMGRDLCCVILLNGAVQLADKNKASAALLKKLTENGTKILSCGTCLDSFGLSAQQIIGERTTMHDVIQRLHQADLVIRP